MFAAGASCLIALACGTEPATVAPPTPAPPEVAPAVPEVPAEAPTTTPSELTVLGTRTFTDVEVAAIAVEVPSPDRDFLRAERMDEGYQLLVAPEATPRDAARLVSFTRLSASTKPYAAASYVSLQRIRLRGHTMRTTREGGERQPALEGAFGIAFVGVIDGAISRRSAPSDPTFVILTNGMRGWVSARDLASFDACVPTRELIARMLEGRTEDSLRTATIGHVPVEGAFSRERPFYLVEPEAGAARFTLLTRNHLCGSASPIFTTSLGDIRDVRFGSGDHFPLVALGVLLDDAVTRWHVLRPGSGRELLTRDLRTHPATPDAELDTLELGPRRASQLERGQVKITLADGRSATYAYVSTSDTFELVGGDATTGAAQND